MTPVCATVVPSDVVLGVDIGTTSTKVAAFAADGTVHGSAEHGYPLLEPRPGWAVQDPEQILATVERTLREAVQATAAAATAAAATAATATATPRIAGVCFSAAMHTLVGVDAQDRPVGPLLTWADLRAREQAERLVLEHPELHGRTGTPSHPMAPLPKLMWLRENDPEGFAGTRRWVGIKDLVLHRLTGRWATDHSVASGTGLMDLERLAWDPAALLLAGIGADQLPPLVPVTERMALLPDAATRIGLDADVPLVIGGGDGPLANLGVGAVLPGVAACSIGTSGALRLTVDRPLVDDGRRLFSYALTPGRWTVGGAINNGGVVLAWAQEALAPDLGPGGAEELLALAAEVPPGSDGLLMLPYILGERAPHWSALPRGAYIGLKRSHGRGHLVRAAIEGVCQQLRLVLDSLRGAGADVRELRATGGFARSPLWRQILADTLGMPVGFPTGHDGSAFGAALIGMEVLGIVESIDRAHELVRIDQVVEPDPQAAAVLTALSPTFGALYAALTPAFEALREHDERVGAPIR